MNAYEMFDELKDNIGRNDVSASGHWTEASLLRKLNGGQRKAFHLISQTPGDWFIKKSPALTPSSNQITLPTDCAKPVYMEGVTSGNEIPINTTIRERRASRLTGFSLDQVGHDAYLLEKVIEVNQDSFSEQVYLWYERRIPDLHFGTASAGAATSLTLEDSKQESMQDDYYNEMTIEIVSGTAAGLRTTISDYAGNTRICTLAAGTPDDTSVYGLVTVLPQEAVDYIILDATCALLAKPASALDPKYFEYFNTQRKEAKNNIEEWCSIRHKNSNRMRSLGNYGEL